MEIKYNIEVCGYDPCKDISPVSPNDSIDLCDAFANGFVPENIVIGDSDFDGNDEPKSIIGRPANDFDAIHMAETAKVLAQSKSTGSKDSGAE